MKRKPTVIFSKTGEEFSTEEISKVNDEFSFFLNTQSEEIDENLITIYQNVYYFSKKFKPPKDMIVNEKEAFFAYSILESHVVKQIETFQLDLRIFRKFLNIKKEYFEDVKSILKYYSNMKSAQVLLGEIERKIDTRINSGGKFIRNKHALRVKFLESFKRIQKQFHSKMPSSPISPISPSMSEKFFFRKNVFGNEKAENFKDVSYDLLCESLSDLTNLKFSLKKMISEIKLQKYNFQRISITIPKEFLFLVEEMRRRRKFEEEFYMKLKELYDFQIDEKLKRTNFTKKFSSLHIPKPSFLVSEIKIIEIDEYVNEEKFLEKNKKNFSFEGSEGETDIDLLSFSSVDPNELLDCLNAREEELEKKEETILKLKLSLNELKESDSNENEKLKKRINVLNETISEKESTFLGKIQKDRENFKILKEKNENLEKVYNEKIEKILKEKQIEKEKIEEKIMNLSQKIKIEQEKEIEKKEIFKKIKEEKNVLSESLSLSSSKITSMEDEMLILKKKLSESLLLNERFKEKHENAMDLVHKVVDLVKEKEEKIQKMKSVIDSLIGKIKM